MSAAIPEKPTEYVLRVLGRQPRKLDSFLQEYIEKFH